MLLLSRSLRNINHMKRYILLLFVVVSLSGYSQKTFFCKNFDYKPKMDTTIDGVWSPIDVRWPDSAYVEYPSNPNYYDLGITPTVDLELKYKALYYDSTIYFLFRRVDDEIVNGYNIDGTPDNSVADSLVNRDATAIYFYLESDTAQYLKENKVDSITWLRFVWQADDMEAQLPGGEIVNTFEEAHSEIIQWTASGYYWAKLSVNIGKIAPYLFDVTKDSVDNNVIYDTLSLDTTYMAFEVELDENDKEMTAPYAIQTRAYWGRNVGENALDNVERWSWLYFIHSSFDYEPASIKYTPESFAAIYPIPASDYLTIKLESFDRVSYYLYDITGRLVKSDRFDGVENTVETSEINSGTYLLRILDSKGNSMSKKVLIIN
jgi:hypothetical protein